MIVPIGTRGSTSCTSARNIPKRAPGRIGILLLLRFQLKMISQLAI
ncbi:MAG TPA: hypothetical protein VFW83_03115 [Bryobacteraceae bacterium]|nr:hypothetical protein [Bryobacteraceae bacterium]